MIDSEPITGSFFIADRELSDCGDVIHSRVELCVDPWFLVV